MGSGHSYRQNLLPCCYGCDVQATTNGFEDVNRAGLTGVAIERSLRPDVESVARAAVLPGADGVLPHPGAYVLLPCFPG